MKIIGLLSILVSCQLCLGRADTNILAVSEWSKPVALRNEELHDQLIRGRLLITQGTEPAYAGRNPNIGAMTFVELQNVTEACCGAIDIYFAVTNLHCELSDSAGKAVNVSSVTWGGRGPFVPCWVNVPYNSTLRLFVNGGHMDGLTLYPSGEPWRCWSIPKGDTNTYYLTGTLNLASHTNRSEPPGVTESHYRTTLVFPKTMITTGDKARLGQGDRK